jgi:hypothetical protein
MRGGGGAEAMVGSITGAVITGAGGKLGVGR